MDEELWPSVPGWCGYTAYPDGTLTTAELIAWRKELREKQKRRKPMGFSPWPDEGDT